MEWDQIAENWAIMAKRLCAANPTSTRQVSGVAADLPPAAQIFDALKRPIDSQIVRTDSPDQATQR